MNRSAAGPLRNGHGEQPTRATADPTHETAAIAEAELRQAPADRRPATPARHERWRSLVAIGAGAVLGANARYVAGLWAIEHWGAGFPWGTLAINALGSFILGFYLTLVTERFIGRSTTRLFLATGVLGSFTTFSTFSFEALRLLASGRTIDAIGYAAASLLGCLVAVAAGTIAAHAL
ncbi:MAG: fluoride efflux transporter CrcB [Thermomicrobiales bacterium]|nr:fluoride efflux transporter CrcB [Thermomicrobiales bacterium]